LPAATSAWWEAWISFWEALADSFDPQLARDEKSRSNDHGNHGDGRLGGGYAAACGSDGE